MQQHSCHAASRSTLHSPRRLRLSLASIVLHHPARLPRPPRPAMASAAALKAAQSLFPGCQRDGEFLQSVRSSLDHLGFSKDNSIALVATCRDEITHHFYRKIDEIYGESFDMSALAGLVTCGPTGLKAGMSHAPNQSGSEKYIFFAFPHIGIDKEGQQGKIHRIGRSQASSACGALLAMHKVIAHNQGSIPDADLDADELEVSFLKKRLGSHIKALPQKPSEFSLADITKLTMEVTAKELESYIHKAGITGTVDYAVITGVQIHAGADSFTGEKGFEDYIFPGEKYAMLGNERKEI
eukprot:SM000183S03971  [mRNA]  locus=s183:19529:21445:- [translate_table: standard]